MASIDSVAVNIVFPRIRAGAYFIFQLKGLALIHGRALITFSLNGLENGLIVPENLGAYSRKYCNNGF